MATDHNFRIKNGLEVGGVLIVNSSGQLQALQVSSHQHYLDDVEAKFGNSGDLKIYHSGNNSYISHSNTSGYLRIGSGTKELFIHGERVDLRSDTGNESMLQAFRNGAVKLYYDAVERVSTTSGGAQVTGDLSVSGNLYITGDVDSVSVTDLDVVDKTITVGQGQSASNSTGSGLIVSGSNANMLWDNSDDRWEFNKDIYTSGKIDLGNSRIYASGDSNSMHFDVPSALIGPSTTTSSNPSLGTSSYRFDGLFSSTGNFSGNVTIAGADIDIASIIRHIGDTDTFFGFHGNDLWRVATGGVERFEVGNTGIRVNDGGNDVDFTIESNNNADMFYLDGTNDKIGIGTATPSGILDVEGTGVAATPTVEITNTSSSIFNHSINAFAPNLAAGENNIFIIGKAGSTKNSGYIGYKYAGDGSNSNVLTFGHWSSNNLMNLTGDGKLGIGTTAPAEKLEVSGGHIKITNGGNTNLYINANNSGSDATIYFEEADSVKAKIQHDASHDRMVFSDGANADTLYIRGGNVGIGNSIPLDPLDVMGNIRFTGDLKFTAFADMDIKQTTQTKDIVFWTSASGASNTEKVRITDDGKVSIGAGSSPVDLLTISGDGKYIASHDGTNYAFRLGADSSGDGNFILYDSSGNVKVKLYGEAGAANYINNGGNFGVGTASPNSLADLHVADTSDARIWLDATSGSTLELYAGSGTSIFNRSNSFLSFGVDNTEKMRINTGGNVGIGTTNPIQKLQVVGNVYANSGDIYLDSTRKLIWGNSQQWIQCSNNGQMKFIVNNGERLYIQTDGRIETRMNKHFRIDDVGNLGTTIRYYKIATVNKGNSGITIKGTLANHVESFGTSKFDLAIFGRENNSGANISVTGTVDVSSPNSGVRIVKQSGSGTYINYDVYIVVPKYCHADVEATIHGASNGTSTYIDWHGNNTFVTTAPTGAAVELNTSSLAAGHYQVTDSVISDAILDVPAAPSITSTTVVNETIELVFGQSATTGVDHYEVHSDGATGSDYSLIARVPPEDIASSMSVVDASFDDSGTVAYRVYAVKNGVYSSPATTTRSFSMPSLDVSSMSVVPDTNTYHIQYNLPSTRFLDHVEIYVDAEASNSNLARSGASLIYSGSNPSFKYNISSSDMEKYHQFWVECVSV